MLVENSTVFTVSSLACPNLSNTLQVHELPVRDISFLSADASVSAVGIEGILELGQIQEPLVMPLNLQVRHC